MGIEASNTMLMDFFLKERESLLVIAFHVEHFYNILSFIILITDCDSQELVNKSTDVVPNLTHNDLKNRSFSFELEQH